MSLHTPATPPENGQPPLCAPFDPAPRAPRFAAPIGACDCHAHVIGPLHRYPLVPTRSYTPVDAPLAAWQHMLRVLGLTRGVIIQPSFYGTDNRATLDAVAMAGPEFRAVVVTDSDVSRTVLDVMHKAGARGVRINLLFAGGADIADLRSYAQRLADRGWHLQFLADVSRLMPETWEVLDNLPCDLVFDHMGHMPATKGVDAPGFQSLLRLLESGRTWVKLSGAYRITAMNRPPYGDTAVLARALIAARPDRMIWGSDWPHPAIGVAMPQDGALLDMLFDWANGDETLIRRILVDNPARLYGFDPIASPS